MTQARFALDLDFKAVDQGDGTLRLVGYGSTFTEDRDREMVTPQALQGSVTKFLQNGVLLLQHNPDRVIGRVTKATVDNIGMLVEAEVPPPPAGSEAWHHKAYHDIKNGLLRAFSIGGLFTKIKSAITAMDLMELSVVTIPSNASSLFNVVQKAFDLDTEATDFDAYAEGYKAAMSAAERNNLSDSDFGYVDSDGKGHFPLNDQAHVRAAVTMFSRASFPDAATKKKCAAKILSRARKYGIDVADDSPVAQAAGKSFDLTDEELILFGNPDAPKPRGLMNANARTLPAENQQTLQATLSTLSADLDALLAR